MLRMIAMRWELRRDLWFRQAKDARSYPGFESSLADGKAQFGPPFVLDVGIEEAAGFLRGLKGSSFVMEWRLTPDNYWGVRLDRIDVLMLRRHFPFQWRGQLGDLLLKFVRIDCAWFSGAWQELVNTGYGLFDRHR